jgi:hypothetical protein
MTNENVNQIFKIPNTPQGKLFVELAREYASPCYKVICKGRTINKKKCKTARMSKLEIRVCQNNGSIPLKLADNIGIYLTLKNGRRIGARDVQYYDQLREEYAFVKLENDSLTKVVEILRRRLYEINTYAKTIKEITNETE